MTATNLRARRYSAPWFAAGLWLWAGAAALATEPDSAATGVVATGSGPLQTDIVVELFEPASPDGEVPARFVPARQLEEGDEVHYTIRVRNPGQDEATDVRVTKRLPFGMHYVPASAMGPACDIEFSADGGATFEARPAAAGLTHVRWSLRRPLAPGATALLRFRATFR